MFYNAHRRTQLMRHRYRICVVAVATVGLTGLATACKTSSHRTVHISEYKEEARPVDRPVQAEGSEWEMESPGEMVVEP